MRTERSPLSEARLAGRAAGLALILLGPAFVGFARGQVITEFPIPTANSDPLLITPGPDGNLWFTERDASQIGRITTVAPAVPRGQPVLTAPSARTPRAVPPRSGAVAQPLPARKDRLSENCPSFAPARDG